MERRALMGAPRPPLPVFSRIAWQDGATEGTVADELRRGADEVGVEVLGRPG